MAAFFAKDEVCGAGLRTRIARHNPRCQGAAHDGTAIRHCHRLPFRRDLHSNLAGIAVSFSQVTVSPRATLQRRPRVTASR